MLRADLDERFSPVTLDPSSTDSQTAIRSTTYLSELNAGLGKPPSSRPRRRGCGDAGHSNVTVEADREVYRARLAVVANAACYGGPPSGTHHNGGSGKPTARDRRTRRSGEPATHQLDHDHAFSQSQWADTRIDGFAAASCGRCASFRPSGRGSLGRTPIEIEGVDEPLTILAPASH
jgi:hypothetical protein